MIKMEKSRESRNPDSGKGTRMRIVMLTEHFSPHIGGVEKHVLNLCGELARKGHTVSVLTRRYHPALAVEEFLGPLRVLRFPSPQAARARRGAEWAGLLRYLPLLLEADVVHVHDHTPFLRWYLPFRILLARKPVYVTFHGYEGSVPPALRDRIGHKCVERLTRGNICVGSYLEKWYGTRSNAITYGAVRAPVEVASPVGRNIVFIGRLEPDTGIMTYLEAMPMIQQLWKHPLKLIVCGEGSLREHVIEFANNHSLDVEVLGAVPDPTHWIRQSRYVFVSGYLGILEAMICRRIVFAVYDNPLKRDYLCMMPGAENRLILSGSPEELARGFRDVSENSDRERSLIEQAYAFACEQTWERLAETYLDLYRSKGDL